MVEDFLGAGRKTLIVHHEQVPALHWPHISDGGGTKQDSDRYPGVLGGSSGQETAGLPPLHRLQPH